MARAPWARRRNDFGGGTKGGGKGGGRGTREGGKTACYWPQGGKGNTGTQGGADIRVDMRGKSGQLLP